MSVRVNEVIIKTLTLWREERPEYVYSLVLQIEFGN
jgi:hypothetical protein